MLASWRTVTRKTTFIPAVRDSWLLNPDQLPCNWDCDCDCDGEVNTKA